MAQEYTLKDLGPLLEGLSKPKKNNTPPKVVPEKPASEEACKYYGLSREHAAEAMAGNPKTAKTADRSMLDMLSKAIDIEMVAEGDKPGDKVAIQKKGPQIIQRLANCKNSKGV